MIRKRVEKVLVWHISNLLDFTPRGLDPSPPMAARWSLLTCGETIASCDLLKPGWNTATLQPAKRSLALAGTRRRAKLRLYISRCS